MLLSRDVYSSNATLFRADSYWIVKIFCEFDFTNYPFDHQYCALRMTNSHLIVNVYEKTSFGWKEKKQQEFGGYYLKQDVFRHVRNGSFGQFCAFGVKNKLTRQIGPYIYQYYLPSNVIVVTSFFSIIVPLSAIPGRVALTVTQMLTLMSIFIHQMVLL